MLHPIFVLKPPTTVNDSAALTVTITTVAVPVAGAVLLARVVVLVQHRVAAGQVALPTVRLAVPQPVRVVLGVLGAVVQGARAFVRGVVVHRVVTAVLAVARVAPDRSGKVCPLPSILFYTHGGYCDITPTCQRQAGTSGRLYPSR